MTDEPRAPKRKKKKRLPRDFRDLRAKTRSRELLAGAGAAVTIAGLAAVGVGESSIGAMATLAGLALLMFAVHTYGRLGEEA